MIRSLKKTARNRKKIRGGDETEIGDKEAETKRKQRKQEARKGKKTTNGRKESRREWRMAEEKKK